MNTVHSTSATLASLNSADVYDSDGIDPRESPPLQQKTLKLRITPSPPPKVTEAKPSLGQTVLLQYMAGGRNPDIAHFASQCVPSDESEEDEDDDEDDEDEDIGRTRESTSEFLNNDSDSDKDDDEDSTDEDGVRRSHKEISDQNHKRLFIGETRQRYSTDARPSRPEQQQQPSVHREGRERSPRGKQRQQSPNSPLTLDNGDDAMSLDEPSPPPQRPPQQSHQHGRQQQEKPERSPEHDRKQQHAGSGAAGTVPLAGANLAAIAMAAAGAIANPGQSGQPSDVTIPRTTSIGIRPDTSLAPPPPPRSPGAKRDHSGALKPISVAPGGLRLESIVLSPQQQHGGRPAGPMDAAGSRSGGGLSPEQMRRQYSSSSQNAVPAYSPRPGSTASHQDQQSDQSQLLTPASAVTPGAMSASSTTFPPLLLRDDRSVVGSTGASSLATPSSTHSPNDYHSPFSPNGTGVAASPAQITAFSPLNQADFHVYRQSTGSSLPSLPPMQPYGSPRNDINSAASPMSANTPAGHTPSNHSSSGSAGQSQQTLLPPILTMRRQTAHTWVDWPASRLPWTPIEPDGDVSATGPGSMILPPVRHDSTPRQQPSIESLTSHMLPHSPNGQHMPPPPLAHPQQQPQQRPSQPLHTAAQGPYKCEVPGCTAAPFPTQYLLNSHANVHSSARPHYCPVSGCPRSETGKGFKRKNEMIRHGLVHQSPGYVCPFCPDREHKYPRPDNLQRHVRVHHKEKSKDDPLLRDVLAQRAEGPSRGRRRRL
ncbi:hypothetical protein SPBR_02330 [Sporothrix brasiliensis 5110]|uniref:C2H2-type domain-containing protein n=1 Tax=Sporothrix brasiliensis 5110 TaxID=1398154 RepID=A0A0C2J4W4_9PEZI|nr:uncharacterized protein SPBR_02330 [Sporothrix brasiliensis 5110]KIH92107.1 hypothetical protein SPBR_02330 [Sporothrix brasiliensis 5110]